MASVSSFKHSSSCFKDSSALYVEPISVCTCSANFHLPCPYHLKKPPLSGQDHEERPNRQEPFTINSSNFRSSDFHGVSCSPSTQDQAKKIMLFGVCVTVSGSGRGSFDSSSSSSVSSQTSKRKRAEEEEDSAKMEQGNHQKQQRQSEVEKEAERLGICLDLKLSWEFPTSVIESGSSSTSSVSKKSVVCNFTEDNNNNQIKKNSIAPGVILDEDPWVFNKKLTLTDINRHHMRLLLRRRSVEKYLLPKLGFSVDDNGQRVFVRDLDKNSVHQLTLATWVGGKCYALNQNWYKDFVERRRLKEGDDIELRCNAAGSEVTFRVLSRRIRGPGEEAPS